ncbi:PSD1 and planctomycete cytochrome C domain-containing protein [Planctellipticum variicoloris]|uniref:PSD1 and planctomycete cytochrome C domain-containing protein n=1 Tax=Planctellipticum variicoloris TaxID=3064265 RepID=UPI003013DE2E|nr:PSD1 and planctomycete cytochrome C domain-containing protein [Planctomycetaceae bacterium SH412]
MRPAACLGLACLLVPLSAHAADDAGLELFEKKIRPVLVQHCYECHAADAKKLGGGLLLDSRQGLRTGGDSGPAIPANVADQSLLLQALRYDGEIQMPPKGKLPAEVIADFETWLKLGAPDPRDGEPSTRLVEDWSETFRNRADWWSLKPVREPVVPEPKLADWSAHPVDHFVLSRLEADQLAPADAATPRTLARRLGLVLTGLPPAGELVDAFVHDCEHAGVAPGERLPPAAVEKLVDALLASPHFGERWARHWMDVVRFTETHGNEWNYEVHHAWRYRDYLIRAFNADVPYDQFVLEHIAGDLLPEPRWNAAGRFQESVIGTGFYRFGEVNHDDCISLLELGYDVVDNQIDTLTKAFQATTVACARCHDHKLDAVSTRDYYALLGILRSSRLVAQTIDAPEVNIPAKERLRALKSELRRELAAVWQRDAGGIASYLQAAAARHAKAADAESLAAGLDAARLDKWVAALTAEKTPLEDPLEPWRRLVRSPTADAESFAKAWAAIADEYAREDQTRTDFNQANYTSWADFRTGEPTGWQVGGQGLRDARPHSGDFAVGVEGESLVKGLLPAGTFTNSLSDTLNGTLRSPVLPLGKAHISLQVLGQRSSAVRLVSNNCQLNYKNYRALTSPDLQWVTFSPPPDREALRTYAELMTMFDNPKFPDQLSALGGDTANYKVPWEQAAANPRSYFGVTRVVLHDVAEPPKPELTHLRPLFASEVPATTAEVAARYAAVVDAALKRWSDDAATDDDVRWLNSLLTRELLGNRPGLSSKLDELVRQYRETEATLSLPTVVAGVSDGNGSYDQPVFVRGNCRQPGEIVPRGYLEVLRPRLIEASLTPSATPAERRPLQGSGRLELARQIASADNPLTARVMVNRIWHHLFGTGLVRTVDDFGHAGELPSHPELLDFLAAQYVADGWSTKRLIRSIVLSRTFQLSSRPTPLAAERGPANRLLHHYPSRRLEAEAIRDSILAASGRLDDRLFGQSVQPFRDKEYADRRLFPGPLDGDGRRSIYIKNTLMEPPRFLAAFNFPGGKVAQGRRDVTNVPAQALALLNDPFVVQQADVWAQRLITRTDDTVASRIDHMLATALGRPATADERQRFEQTALQLAELHQIAPGDVLQSQVVWKDLAHAVFNLKEFIYIP